MKRFLLPVGATLVATAALAPGIASAQPTTRAHAHAYEHVYREVVHAQGHRAPGRNIVKDGDRPRQTPVRRGDGRVALDPATDVATRSGGGRRGLE